MTAKNITCMDGELVASIQRGTNHKFIQYYTFKKKISDARDPSSISGHGPDENTFSAISFLVFCFSILVNCIQYSLCMYEDYRFVISVIIIQPDK